MVTIAEMVVPAIDLVRNEGSAPSKRAEVKLDPCVVDDRVVVGEHVPERVPDELNDFALGLDGARGSGKVFEIRFAIGLAVLSRRSRRSMRAESSEILPQLLALERAPVGRRMKGMVQC
jgi:hypothetical protein